jgi:hypothetical protein
MVQRIGKWVYTALASVALAVALGGPAVLPLAARADGHSPSRLHTKYLCQKYYHSCWHTVYETYSYQAAMAWYSQQPGNARVVAQK